METCRALLVDAFASEPFSGRAAGVVPDAEGLSASQMRAVARELGADATAFLLPSRSADRRVRYFTPAGEVDRCCHAAVAAHAHLHEERGIDAGTHSLATNAGDLAVEVTPEGVVWVPQPRPTVAAIDLDYDRAAAALGVDPAALSDVAAELPAAVASAGPSFLVVPVSFLEPLGGAEPDADAVAALADEHAVDGVYAFTFDALSAESTLHARAFAPGFGVREDPATGPAAGACGAYLRRVGAFEGEAGGGSERPVGDRVDARGIPAEMRFEQGHFVDRPSAVLVRVGETVRVGGRAVAAFDGSVAVPADEDDGIIEA
ncbi:PhzF family phenazine biosynthesis protein [Halegenticoccus soli]|uniref:PhzF family phenazine biosynthesis protein n=1 Tax=Halegenticoccus soli TaxID=1985678 RepID=UPI000C6EA82C|nr:PhzF family phenazine biosynthesis protein [Halegenticoccus soli]